jgi:hypothetical protein
MPTSTPGTPSTKTAQAPRLTRNLAQAPPPTNTRSPGARFTALRTQAGGSSGIINTSGYAVQMGQVFPQGVN